MTFVTKSVVYLAGRIIPASIGLGGVAVYTRLLDPASIGVFALIVSTTLLVSAIGYTWLRVAALRFVAGCTDDALPDLFATILALFAATSVVFVPILVTVLHVWAPALPPVSLALAAAALVASGWYDLNASLLQARMSVANWSLLNLSRAVGILVLSTCFILAGRKANALLLGFILGNGLTIAFARLWLPAAAGSFDRALLGRCFRFGWPQSLGAALAYAAPVGQRWLVNAGVGAAGLGIFAVAQDFGTLTLASLIGSISLAGIPLAFAAKDRGDAAGLSAQLKSNARLIFAVALPATAGLCLLAVPVSHLVFGARFWNGAAAIVTLVALTALAVNLRVYYFDQAFELAIQPLPQAIISFVGTAIAIGGCALLVPAYAAAGAALAALVAGFTCLGLSIVWGARVVAMPIPADDWIKTIMATAGMSVVLALVPKSTSVVAFACEVAGGCIIYIALSIVARPSLIRRCLGHRAAALGR